MLDPSIRTVHFIGIGGSGMSAIAWVVLKRGYRVTGSDLGANGQTARLAEAGATIYRGHAADNLGDPDVVVVSTAIPAHNPERVAAQERGIPIWQRAKMLAAIMAGGKSIAIAGAHGKTTTTSVTGLLLQRAGLDPTVLIGGELNDFGGNACVGRPDLIVAEADESDGSFLLFTPDVAVVTNVEADHLDHWKNYESLLEGYAQFLRQIKPGGKAIICADSPGAIEAMQRSGCNAVLYSIADAANAQWQARNISIHANVTRFECLHNGQSLGEFELSVPGRHNVANALAALAVADEYGISVDVCRGILPSYHGAGRRWDILGSANGVTIIDDYAHHPTEIAATLAAARASCNGSGGRVIAVFQPHRFTRTESLSEQFASAFVSADLAVVTDVYSAGEKPIDGVNGELIYNGICRHGSPQTYYVPQLDGVPSFLQEHIRPGDLVLMMGAGDIWRASRQLLSALRERTTAVA